MRKVHVTCEDSACPPGALSEQALLIGQALTWCVSVRGDQEGEEHLGLCLCSSGLVHSGQMAVPIIIRLRMNGQLILNGRRRANVSFICLTSYLGFKRQLYSSLASL